MTINNVKSIPVIEGARRATEITGMDQENLNQLEQRLTVTPPNPEVPEKPVRRRYTAEYKLDILRKADLYTDPGSRGALLRREGLYASNLTTWRRQRDEGTLAALKPKKRGRKAALPNPLANENERLRKENVRLTKRLNHAELIIDVQKKISQILGITLDTLPENEND
jgi:transposase-like protein